MVFNPDKPENQDQEVRFLQLRLLTMYGGSPGIRDLGLLQSAVSRADNLIAYGNPTIYDIATAYAYGISKNHPFNDGNKRTALAVTCSILLLNNRKLVASTNDIVSHMVDLASSNISEAEFSAWLKLKCEYYQYDNCNSRPEFSKLSDIVIEEYSECFVELFNK